MSDTNDRSTEDTGGDDDAGADPSSPDAPSDAWAGSDTPPLDDAWTGDVSTFDNAWTHGPMAGTAGAPGESPAPTGSATPGPDDGAGWGAARPAPTPTTPGATGYVPSSALPPISEPTAPDWSPPGTPTGPTPDWSPPGTHTGATPDWSPPGTPAGAAAGWSPPGTPTGATPDWSPPGTPAGATPDWPPPGTPTGATPGAAAGAPVGSGAAAWTPPGQVAPPPPQPTWGSPAPPAPPGAWYPPGVPLPPGGGQSPAAGGWAPGYNVGAPPYATRRKNNGMALASLITGIVGVFFCFLPVLSLLAIVFGHVGLSQLKQRADREQGRGMAIAGLVIGYLTLVAAIGFWVLVATSDTSDVPAADPVSSIPEFGSDPQLDQLARDCEAADLDACDRLWLQGTEGSGYEEYGNTCGGRQPLPPDESSVFHERCATVFDDTSQ